MAYGKLYDDDGFRYVDATKDGKALNAVLEWEANGDEGMLVLDKQGLFVEATIRSPIAVTPFMKVMEMSKRRNTKGLHSRHSITFV